LLNGGNYPYLRVYKKTLRKSPRVYGTFLNYQFSKNAALKGKKYSTNNCFEWF
jgi:hypothetical protein